MVQIEEGVWDTESFFLWNKQPRNQRICLSNEKVRIKECSTSWTIAPRSQLMGNSMLIAFALMCKKYKYEIPSEHKIGA